MLPFASMSTPVALLHAVMPAGNVAQLSNRYDPESAAIDWRLTADWSTTAAHTTAIRTRLITGSLRRAVFGRCNPTRCSNRRFTDKDRAMAQRSLVPSYATTRSMWLRGPVAEP